MTDDTIMQLVKERDALHTLLAPVPELLERAALMAEWCYGCGGPDAMQANRDAAALRELAQALRAAMGEENHVTR